MSQVANAQKTTASPAISPRVTATIGASAISTIRAPASTVMARAHGHPVRRREILAARTRRASADATKIPAAAYRNTPTDQDMTASTAALAPPT